ncbi:Tripartite ATP-independent transporter DctP family solute receptor OS=Ureibacillus acetophenoni OX=614649 GN=SAMN05877842_107132 PE=3 SV=1 [Ureibacillus acetophenoni]
MKFHKLWLVTILVFLVMIITACGESSSSTGDKSIKLKLGHPAAVGTAYDVAAKAFAEELKEKTNGKVIIEVYDSNQLGDERSMIEQVQLGSLDMSVTGLSPVTNFVPELQVFEFPFLFNSREHAHKAFDGEVGQEITKKLEEAGFKNLGYWEYGMKNISNTEKDVKSVEDMKGIKMRVQENELLIATYESLGAIPTPIPFPEVYTSTQQGIVQAYEGPYQSYSDIKLYEIMKHVSEIPIVMGSSLFLMNKELFDSFDQETQEIIMELSEKYTKFEREESQKLNEQFKQDTINAGVTITPIEEIDIESFREAVQPVYEKYPQFSEYIEKIRGLE